VDRSDKNDSSRKKYRIDRRLGRRRFAINVVSSTQREAVIAKIV